MISILILISLAGSTLQQLQIPGVLYQDDLQKLGPRLEESRDELSERNILFKTIEFASIERIKPPTFIRIEDVNTEKPIQREDLPAIVTPSSRAHYGDYGDPNQKFEEAPTGETFAPAAPQETFITPESPRKEEPTIGVPYKKFQETPTEVTFAPPAPQETLITPETPRNEEPIIEVPNQKFQEAPTGETFAPAAPQQTFISPETQRKKQQISSLVVKKVLHKYITHGEDYPLRVPATQQFEEKPAEEAHTTIAHQDTFRTFLEVKRKEELVGVVQKNLILVPLERLHVDRKFVEITTKFTMFLLNQPRIQRFLEITIEKIQVLRESYQEFTLFFLQQSEQVKFVEVAREKIYRPLKRIYFKEEYELGQAWSEFYREVQFSELFLTEMFGTLECQSLGNKLMGVPEIAQLVGIVESPRVSLADTFLQKFAAIKSGENQQDEERRVQLNQFLNNVTVQEEIRELAIPPPNELWNLIIHHLRGVLEPITQYLDLAGIRNIEDLTRAIQHYADLKSLRTAENPHILQLTAELAIYVLKESHVHSFVDFTLEILPRISPALVSVETILESPKCHPFLNATMSMAIAVRKFYHTIQVTYLEVLTELEEPMKVLKKELESKEFQESIERILSLKFFVTLNEMSESYGINLVGLIKKFQVTIVNYEYPLQQLLYRIQVHIEYTFYNLVEEMGGTWLTRRVYYTVEVITKLYRNSKFAVYLHQTLDDLPQRMKSWEIYRAEDLLRVIQQKGIFKQIFLDYFQLSQRFTDFLNDVIIYILDDVHVRMFVDKVLSNLARLHAIYGEVRGFLQKPDAAPLLNLLEDGFSSVSMLVLKLEWRLRSLYADITSEWISSQSTLINGLQSSEIPKVYERFLRLREVIQLNQIFEAYGLHPLDYFGYFKDHARRNLIRREALNETLPLANAGSNNDSLENNGRMETITTEMKLWNSTMSLLEAPFDDGLVIVGLTNANDLIERVRILAHLLQRLNIKNLTPEFIGQSAVAVGTELVTLVLKEPHIQAFTNTTLEILPQLPPIFRVIDDFLRQPENKPLFDGILTTLPPLQGIVGNVEERMRLILINVVADTDRIFGKFKQDLASPEVQEVVRKLMSLPVIAEELNAVTRNFESTIG